MMSNASPDLWKETLVIFSSVLKETKDLMENNLESIGVPQNESLLAISEMKFEAWSILQKVAMNECSDTLILDKLRRRFESHFRYNQNGLPRIWKPTDDIDGLYARSKQLVV